MSDHALKPGTWLEMSNDAKLAYAAKNALLWEIVRAVAPGAGGDIDDWAKGLPAKIAAQAEVNAALLEACETAERAFRTADDPHAEIAALTILRDAIAKAKETP